MQNILAISLCFLLFFPAEDTPPFSVGMEQAAPEEDLRFSQYPSQSDGLHLTQDEVDLLARLVYLEARGECEAGQQAVAEVVLNRVLSDQFPDTVEDVIFQPGQFAPASLLDSTEAEPAQIEAVYAALSGENPILEPDVVYFSTAPQNDRVFIKIENHWFCRL